MYGGFADGFTTANGRSRTGSRRIRLSRQFARVPVRESSREFARVDARVREIKREFAKDTRMDSQRIYGGFAD